MRELEFLPTWYPQMHRRRRMVRLQSYLMLAVGGGLGLWLFLVHNNIRGAQAYEADLGAELKVAITNCDSIDLRKKDLEDLSSRERMFAKLGIHVDMARLIRALDQAMPKDVALTGIEIDGEQSLAPQNAVQSRLVSPAESDAPVEHLLRVKVQGLAPTDVDVGNLMSELGTMKFIDQVAITHSWEKPDKGHLLREFELTFVIDLTSPSGK